MSAAARAPGYLVSTDDDMIPPDAQRAMAQRAGSTITETAASDAVYVSDPATVATLTSSAIDGALQLGSARGPCFAGTFVAYSDR